MYETVAGVGHEVSKIDFYSYSVLMAVWGEEKVIHLLSTCQSW